MKFITLLVLATSLFLLSGCERENHSNVSGVSSRSEAIKDMQEQEAGLAKPALASEAKSNSNQPVSLKDANAANLASQAFDRKIVRNANLTVEVSSPGDSQRKVVSI